MTSVLDVDLDTYCGRIGNLYVRHGLCPPFTLRRVAADWMATGIALTHIVAVIDRHLTDHRGRYYSGSGDALFTWLDGFVRKTWHEQHDSRSRVRGPTKQPFPDREWVNRQPSADDEFDASRRPTTRGVPASNRSDAPGYFGADRAPRRTAERIGQNRKHPKRIDQAIAFLRNELAEGEVAATRLEEKAIASGISSRTLDRARARLKVISRRTGFAREGKCWLSLPRTP